MNLMILANMLTGVLSAIMGFTVLFGGWYAQDEEDTFNPQGAREIIRIARRIILACAVLMVLAYAVAVFVPMMGAHAAPTAPKSQTHAAPTCTYVPAVLIVGPNREIQNVTPCVTYVPQVPRDIWQYSPMCQMYQEDTGVQAPAVMLVCEYTITPGHVVKYPDGVTRWTYTAYTYISDANNHQTIHYLTTNDDAYNASQED